MQSSSLSTGGDRDVALGMNLRHLRTLRAVVEAGSIARAAESLYRVPSAVTRSIADLEAALGRPLLDRGARGVLPNATGELVLARAIRIERTLDEARAELVARGHVRAGADVPSIFASMLNGRRLAVYARLVERGSMLPVAREFGLSQPAISASLKDLEEGLGLALFQRGGRHLRATPAGELLALHFKRVLAELRHIEPDIAASEGLLRGVVHVGALPLGRTRILPLAIAGLLPQHPELHVKTLESPYPVLVEGLRSGEIDFLLGALRSGSPSDLQQEALFQDEIAIIARAGHPLAGAGRIDFETLRRASWVLSREGAPSRELLERFFSEARERPPAPAVETGDLAILRGLLVESDMLTAISPHQLRYEVRDGSLVVLDFPLDRTRREIGLTQRAGAAPSPGARALMQRIRDVVAASDDFRPALSS